MILIVIILNGLKHIVLGGQKVFDLQNDGTSSIYRHFLMMRVDINGLYVYTGSVTVMEILLIVMENVVGHL